MSLSGQQGSLGGEVLGGPHLVWARRGQLSCSGLKLLPRARQRQLCKMARHLAVRLPGNLAVE